MKNDSAGKVFSDEELRRRIREVLRENYVLVPDGETKEDCMVHDLLNVVAWYVQWAAGSSR